MTQFLQQLVNGTVLGATYGLIALGYTMVYGIIQLINFAHGEIFMVGAFGGLTVYRYWLPESLAGNAWVALPAVLVVAIAVAVGVRADNCARFVPRRTRVVPDPHHASGVNTSEPHDSAVHTESKPSRSTSVIVPGASAGGPAPQYPMCSPSFTPASSSR